MHASLFDRYESRISFLHRLDPRVKFLGAILLILSNVLLPDGAWLSFFLSWAILVGLNLLADLGAGYTLRRSLIALPFALAAVTALFSIPGAPLAALQLGPWTLVATDAGLLRFLSIIVRSWLSVQAAVLLAATTPFPDLAHALRHLRVPAVLVSIIAFMYRYLFVLTDETMRLLRAREARSARIQGLRSGGSLGWRAKVAGGMAGQLFLRSYERSERVYNAMLARGYQGHLLTMRPHELRTADLLALVGLAALLAVIHLAVRLPYTL